MGLRVRNLQVDVPPDEHDAALAWWADALGGAARQVDGAHHHLDGVRATIGVHVQRIDAGPGGFHLDLEADDPAGEVERLVALGATRLDPGGSQDVTILTDPAGLRLCVTATGQSQHLGARDESVRLQVLMFDAPSDVAATQAAFWAGALGGEAEPVGAPYDAYTWVAGVEGPGGPLDVAVQDIGPDGAARHHVDLHVPTPVERDREVRRLTEAGATRISAHAHWVVLRAPGGGVVCVVPDAKA